jgi:hypothetical protein
VGGILDNIPFRPSPNTIPACSGPSFTLALLKANLNKRKIINSSWNFIEIAHQASAGVSANLTDTAAPKAL